MDLSKLVPLVIYDNNCYLCIKFARIIEALSRDKLNLVGHYSSLGEKLREKVLDEEALNMFWLIDGKVAYGGRAAILPLIKIIIAGNKKHKSKLVDDVCQTNCKSPKAVFIRSASLLSNSRKIKLQ